ncbi:hypothetical protein AAFX19_22150 [Vibrio harveyi]|uniref:hypothetical protein n=1 Tax=Vibrio harveyi TaxID=669 RepID=UPI0038CD8B00
MTEKIVITGLQKTEDNKPKIGVSSTTLGVRIFGHNIDDERRSDMSCCSDGYVYPGNLGASVNRPGEDLPRHIANLPRFSATIEDIEYSGDIKVNSKSAPVGLVLSPAKTMLAADFEQAIHNTQDIWELENDENDDEK